MKKILLCVLLFAAMAAQAQQQMLTPEMLWKLGRVSVAGITKDKQFVIFNVGVPDVEQNKIITHQYRIPLAGGVPQQVADADSLLTNVHAAPDGKYLLFDSAVKLKNVYGSDFYPALTKSNAQVYESLNYRHWDSWEDGKFDHVFLKDKTTGAVKDLMPGEPYDCPTKPFGGDEEYLFSPDGKSVLYVTKKHYGTAYAISTNTDIYKYDIASGTTKNITETNKGYDVAPACSSKGALAWLSMKRDGYESDKNDIIVSNNGALINLTASRDNIHAESFKWSDDGKNIYFIAPINGTLQLFITDNPGMTRKMPLVQQLTDGNFDITGIAGEANGKLVVTRTDFNRAAEIYTIDIKTGAQTQLTHINDEAYKNLGSCKSVKRMVTTTDGKQMLVWVVYPPGFDSTKKYPTLLYCQGGPQSPLTQFYSFRWNFQLIASQGYIIVAPGRRGMPGFGTQWNEQVSKDWGGQVIQDYLSAIDDISKEKYVDTARRGCVGASFGGFSAYALEGLHSGRFKTFIAHDGIFDFRSMYGTTDELFFENWEKGGAYWDKSNAAAQRSFNQSPSNMIDTWNTPILIIQGGKDYRVPIEQGLQAFQAVQLKGIKSRLLFLPDENHWVLKVQNALVWQHEFFKWLKETL